MLKLMTTHNILFRALRGPKGSTWIDTSTDLIGPWLTTNRNRIGSSLVLVPIRPTPFGSLSSEGESSLRPLPKADVCMHPPIPNGSFCRRFSTCRENFGNKTVPLRTGLDKYIAWSSFPVCQLCMSQPDKSFSRCSINSILVPAY